jgi:hypothetical protein
MKKTKKTLPKTHYVCPVDAGHYNSEVRITYCPVCGSLLARV